MSCLDTHPWGQMRPGKYMRAPDGKALIGRLYTCRGPCGTTLLRTGELPRRDGIVYPAWLYILCRRRAEPAPASLRQLVRLAAGTRRERRKRCARRRYRLTRMRAAMRMLGRSLALGPERLPAVLTPDWMLQALRARVLDWIDHLNARRGGAR